MKRRILISLLIAIVVFLQGGNNVYGQSLSCVDHGFCFGITRTAEDVFTFELEAPDTIGWVALGVGPSMVGSYIVMAWPSTNGSAIISQRIADRYRVPSVTAQQSDLNLDVTASGTKDGKFFVKFTRAASVEGSTINTDGQMFVWALHTDKRPSDDSSTTDISIHNAKGRYTLESSPIVSSTDELPSDIEETPVGMSSFDKIIITHAVIMVIVWCIAVPSAIFIARFARNIIPKKWFKLHWGIQQFVASPLSLFGILMAFSSGIKFNSANSHHVLGAIVFGGFVSQLTLGWIHHKLYDPTRKYYPWWTKLHWWWGRIITVLAFIQIYLGLDLYGVTQGVYVAYYLYLGLIVGSFAGLSYYLYRKRKNEIAKYSKSDILYTGIRQDDIEQQSFLKHHE